MPAAPAKAKKNAPAADPRWLLPVRAAGMIVLAGFVPIILGIDVGRRMFWTVAIAALPLGFTAFGFYVWRRVCPLAIFGQLGRIVKRPGKKKAGEWLARNYLYVQFGVLVACLAARNVATNGTPWALAGFLCGIAGAAALASFIYTGKTWCNYLCPVGLVEKLYNEPVTPAAQQNSQCTQCTACKKNCPDIDVELGYWKEQELPSRRVVYFAWPGVVLGFYTYFFLASGTWDYYFSGDWTREAGEAAGWAGPGFWFAPFIPRIVAAPLTLVVFGAVSFVIFAVGQKLACARAKSPAQVKHRSLALAGFCGFVLFYCFAGQPTLRHLPAPVQQIWSILVVLVASIMLVRRWGRKEELYVQEKFARGILRRWEWGDEPPSDSLGDIYLIHTERTKQRDSRLRAYKETIHDMIADGVLSKNEMALLDKLRAQLGISDKDHAKILSELSAEEKRLFDPEYQGSMERRLQTDQYRKELERMVLYAARQGRAPALEGLEALRLEHHVSAADHDAAVAGLRSESGSILTQTREALDEIDRLRRALRRASGHVMTRTEPNAARSPEAKERGGSGLEPATDERRTDRGPQQVRRREGHDMGAGAAERKQSGSSVAFFAYLSRWRQEQHIERSLALLAAIHDPKAFTEIRELHESRDPQKRSSAADLLAAFRAPDDPSVQRTVLAIRRAATPDDDLVDLPPDEAKDAAALVSVAKDSAPYLRAAAVYLLSRFDDAESRAGVVAATSDAVALVRETAIRVIGARGRLTRELVAKAMEDPDTRVVQAVMRAVVPSGGGLAAAGGASPTALAQTTQGVGSSDPGQFATLDPRAALETLSTFEKMILLRNVPLFVGLDPDDLEDLSGIAHERRYAAGMNLCREGETGDEVFIVVSGRVQAWVKGAGGAPRILGESGEGSCIGEMAALDKAPRTAWVTAIAETRTLVLSGIEFKQLLSDRPAIAQGVLAVITARLRDMIATAQKAAS